MATSLLLPVLALAVQALSAVARPAEGGPVRVWLGEGSVAPGAPVQVYVEVAEEGYLVVLRAATDGSVEVLFPGEPRGDSHVTPGTYELRRGDQAAFVATEPLGSGLVLAALSPTPFRFAEFVRAGAWDARALVASWSGADQEATLADIVQRMLGDGYFNYDLVTYSVAPRPYVLESAPAPAPAAFDACAGCSFAGFPLIGSIEPIVPLLCDPFVATCFTFAPFIPARRVVDQGICVIGSTCPEGVGSSAIALASPPRSRVRVATRSELPRRAVPLERPASPASPPPVLPRSRLPDAGTGHVGPRAVHVVALPTVRPRSAATTPRPARRGDAAGPASAALPTRVRLTLPRIPMLRPTSETPPEALPSASSGLVSHSPANALPGSERPSADETRAIVLPAGLAVPARSSLVPRAGQPVAPARGGGGGWGGGTGGTGVAPRTLALPRAPATTGVAGAGAARAGSVRVAGTPVRRR